MTAVEHPDSDRTDVVLRCDSCGRSLRAKDAVLADFDVIWRAAAFIGWQGTEFADGAHHCDSCARIGRRIRRVPHRGPRNWLCTAYD